MKSFGRPKSSNCKNKVLFIGEALLLFKNIFRGYPK
jgi:hypothetical protein